MIQINLFTQKNNQGFALLMTLLVISAVLSITLTLINLSIKQVQLASNTRDSEVAFHAANAGLECIRYWRRAESSSFEAGSSISIECFGESVSPEVRETLNTGDVSGSGNIHRYEYQITWGPGAGDRCSLMRFLVFSTDISSADPEPLRLNRVSENGYMVGYPQPDDRKECEPGGFCTVFSSQGYSTSCDQITRIGTVQRDIFLEF